MAKGKKTTPEKKAAGRPTKYTAAIQKKADEYLSACGNEYWDYHKTRGEKSDGYERKVDIELPSNEGLALFLDISESTLYLWDQKHPIFSETLGRIKLLQKKMLTQGGLNGDYNSTIAKLMLSSNHDMREKSDLTSGDKPIQSNSIAFVTMKPNAADSK